MLLAEVLIECALPGCPEIINLCIHLVTMATAAGTFCCFCCWIFIDFAGVSRAGVWSFSGCILTWNVADLNCLCIIFHGLCLPVIFSEKVCYYLYNYSYEITLINDMFLLQDCV
jgi:hypothetical protein